MCYARGSRKRSRRILRQLEIRHDTLVVLGAWADARIENVLSMVAPNPLNQPESPSSLNILVRTEIIESFSLLLADAGMACIRVFALSLPGQKILNQPCPMTETHTSSGYTTLTKVSI